MVVAGPRLFFVMAMNLFSSAVELGTPATVGIGSDSYAASVTKSSPSGLTLEVTSEVGWVKVFKFSTKYGCYKSGKCYFLALGVAETKLDPSF